MKIHQVLLPHLSTLGLWTPQYEVKLLWLDYVVAEQNTVQPLNFCNLRINNMVSLQSEPFSLKPVAFFHSHKTNSDNAIAIYNFLSVIFSIKSS